MNNWKFNSFLNQTPYNIVYTVTFNGTTVTDLRQVEVENELARMDFLEEEIQAMESFPEVESVINDIKNRN